MFGSDNIVFLASRPDEATIKCLTPQNDWIRTEQSPYTVGAHLANIKLTVGSKGLVSAVTTGLGRYRSGVRRVAAREWRCVWGFRFVRCGIRLVQ